MTVIKRWWMVTLPDGTPYQVRDTQDGAERYARNLGERYGVVEVVRAEQLAGAVEEAARLRDVLRAVLIEPDPIKRNQLAAPMLTNAGGQ
jgi:hypothetical protein